MSEEFQVPRFFLGANSPMGFVSHFSHLYDPEKEWFAYILKGGPGTGKSTLMKRAAKAAVDAGVRTELIFCSSDADSLDAVIFPDLKRCIADGTAPHVLEPQFPGVSDVIVNLGECWDRSSLFKEREKIISVTKKCSALHQRSRRYLSACGALDSDIAKVILESINHEKMIKYADNLSRKLFKKEGEKPGKEAVRLLSAFTPSGMVFFEDTISMLCPTLYVIEDEFGSAAGTLLCYLRERALAAGQEVITCYCPMAPTTRLDHLLLPGLGVGFVSSNRWHSVTLPPYRRIHTTRFMDSANISGRQQRLNFNRKAERELLDEAVLKLQEAKKTHDVLEGLYQQGMDYGKVNEITERIIGEILSLA